MVGGSHFVRNIFWLAFATGGSLITSLVYGLLAARNLGPADFGRFSLIVGIGALMSNLAQGAGSSVLTVLTAQRFRSADALILPGMFSQALIGMVCLAISVPIVLALGRDHGLVLPTAIYCAGSISLLVYSAPIAIFRGLNQMQWSVAQTFAGGFTLVFAWGAISRGATLMGLIVASALAQCLVFVLICIPCIRILTSSERRQASHSVIWEIFRKTMGLSGVTVFQSIHWKVGLIMVQILGGAYALGIYTAGAKPIENLRTVPLVLLLSILPSVSQMAQDNSQRMTAVFVLVTRVVLLLMFPLVGGLIAVSPILIRLLYGSAYSEASGVFSLSLLAVVPATIHLVFIMPLVANHEIKKLAVIYFVAILSECCFDLFVFPHIGLLGATAGVIVGALFTAILADSLAFSIDSVLRNRQIAKLIAAGTMSVLLPFTGILNEHRWLLCGLTVATFLLSARLSESFTFRELMNLRKSINFHAVAVPGSDVP